MKPIYAILEYVQNAKAMLIVVKMPVKAEYASKNVEAIKIAKATFAVQGCAPTVKIAMTAMEEDVITVFVRLQQPVQLPIVVRVIFAPRLAFAKNVVKKQIATD